MLFNVHVKCPNAVTQSYYIPSVVSNYYTLTGSGRIKSLGFPNKYDNDLDISTPIEVAEGNRIQLYFYNFDIEDDDTCSYDYVSGIHI